MNEDVGLPDDVQAMIDLHKKWAVRLENLESEMMLVKLACGGLSEMINVRLAQLAIQSSEGLPG